MAVKANMRLDQKTIDQVLAAVKRGKLPDSVRDVSSGGGGGGDESDDAAVAQSA